MKVFQSILTITALLVLAACGNQAAHDHDHAHDHEHDHADHEEMVSTSDGIHYGEQIEEDGAVNFGDLMNMLENKESVDNVKVIATVGNVCQVKGCWMDIIDETQEGNKIFVQFKDYGFFMPKDLNGAKVVLAGKAYYEETSVEDLKHFAEDKGASQAEIDAITEPKKELKFLASGVKILDSGL
jgi:protein involved in sex pheromone biosynthesis